MYDFSVSHVRYKNAASWVQARNAYNLENLVVDGSRISGDIANDTPGVLTLSMPYREGWTCLVDGGERELLLVNGIFSGVELAPGAHHIELTYTPPYLALSAWISGLTLLALLTAAVGMRARGKKQNAPG